MKTKQRGSKAGRTQIPRLQHGCLVGSPSAPGNTEHRNSSLTDWFSFWPLVFLKMSDIKHSGNICQLHPEWGDKLQLGKTLGYSLSFSCEPQQQSEFVWPVWNQMKGCFNSPATFDTPCETCRYQMQKGFKLLYYSAYNRIIQWREEKLDNNEMKSC